MRSEYLTTINSYGQQNRNLITWFDTDDTIKKVPLIIPSIPLKIREKKNTILYTGL